MSPVPCPMSHVSTSRDSEIFQKLFPVRIPGNSRGFAHVGEKFLPIRDISLAMLVACGIIHMSRATAKRKKGCYQGSQGKCGLPGVGESDLTGAGETGLARSQRKRPTERTGESGEVGWPDTGHTLRGLAVSAATDEPKTAKPQPGELK